MEQRLTEQEKRQAVEHARRLMVEDGYSQNKAADAVGDDLGVSGRTVKRWAVDLGLPLGDLSQDAQKRHAALARETQESYDAPRREALSDKFFAKLGALIDGDLEAKDIKDLATAFGILTDKRRLEEGQATERTETSVSDVRSKVEQRLDELAARRQRKTG